MFVCRLVVAADAAAAAFAIADADDHCSMQQPVGNDSHAFSIRRIVTFTFIEAPFEEHKMYIYCH